MRRLLPNLIPSLLLLASVPVLAGETVRFVACPVYRDTDAGRKSGCWLGTEGDTGRRYDVSDAPFKPSVGRMMLVEGEAAATPDICGGTPLAPVRVAVLDTPCPEVVIPAEGYPSKPSVVPLDTMMAPLSVPRVPPPPPYSRQLYQVEFTFGDDRLMYQHVENIIEKAALYARASQGRVELVGNADADGFKASGTSMKEAPALAQARAAMVREALLRLGVPAARIHVTTNLHPAALPGWPAALALSSKRRVTIIVVPG
jgi:outer membrane protein OmpA-like peptidoglycan-associated protein